MTSMFMCETEVDIIHMCHGEFFQAGVITYLFIVRLPSLDGNTCGCLHRKKKKNEAFSVLWQKDTIGKA